MGDHYHERHRKFGSETHAALALVLFCVPALIFSVFLTLLKFRTEYRCDGFLQNTCGSGCSIALSDTWSALWGLPISGYASGYYFVLLFFGLLVGLWPRNFAPALRFPVLALTTSGLGVAIVFALYAWFGLGTVCEYCVMLYVANIGIYFAGLLLNPEGPVHGLIRGARRFRGVGMMLTAVGLSAFLAIVFVQRRTLAARAAEVLRDRTQLKHLSCDERWFKALPPTNVKLESEGPPEVVVALFVDLACPHCKLEYEFWREYQLANRNTVQVELFHFSADPACGPLDSVALMRNQSCNAALALECLHDLAPGNGQTHLERLFAMQALTEPDFSPEHISELAAELQVPGLLDCMNRDEIRERVQHHIQFGQSQRLSAPPSALLVPMIRQGGKDRPVGRPIGLRGGAKAPGYIDKLMSEVRSRRSSNE